MRKFVQKHSQVQRKDSVNLSHPSKATSKQSQEVHPILHLQHTVGNQAVLRMPQVQTGNSDTAPSTTTPSPVGHDFSRIPVRSIDTRSDTVQIGSPSDSLEREADRVADKVMKMGPRDEVDFPIRQASDAKAVRRTPVSPFSIAEGRIVDEEEERVQTKADNGFVTNPGPATSTKVQAAVSRPGTPLLDKTRAFMESRLGYDFSYVRIHADEHAAEAAKSVNARAFTKGADIVFGRGQYAPHSSAGRWLLAHELTHVVQQGKAQATGDSPAQTPGSSPRIGNDHGPPTLRRVKWSTAQDTGQDVYPWGSGPIGDVYEVETDAGTKIPAWKPHDGRTYWCHGYTFGGAATSRGPFSIWGQQVPTVLADDGWKHAYSCVAQRGDILVFSANNVAHSGIVHSAFEPGGIIDENTSMLNSKWGQLPLNRRSWAINARQYGRYEVFSKNPAFGPCAGKGANER